MISKNPVGTLVLATGVTLVGAFTLVVHTGMNAREKGAMHYDFSFRGATTVPTVAFADLERGAKVVGAKTAGICSGFFGGGEAAAQPAQVASADVEQSGGGNEYTRPAGYPSGYDEEEFPYEAPPAGEDEPAGGGESYGGGFPSGGGYSASSQAGPAAPAAGQAGGKAQAPAGKVSAPETASAMQKEFKGRPGEQRKSALERGYESLSSDNPARPSRGYGGGAASQGGPAGGLPKYGSRGVGSASWGRNGAGAMPMDGQDGLRSEAAGSYNSKMSMGAGAIASAAGAKAPAASAPKPVSSSGGSDSSSGSGSGSASGSGSSASSRDKKESADEDDGGSYSSGSYNFPVTDTSFLGKIITEKRNGVEMKYLSSEDVSAAPSEGLLKAGGMPPLPDDKEIFEEDPENIAELTPERQLELKKEIHSFLKRVENKYGAMTDIFSTSCSLTAQLCKDNKIAGTYLTMTTAKGAKLIMALKYQDCRWQPYTIEFKKPAEN